MKQKLTLSALFLFLSCMFIMGQEWTKEDSVWLKNVLEGKDTLKVNEETKKAIEEGRLIAPSWLRNMDSELELSKDFDNAGTPDSLRISNFDPYTMPPGVYALYVLYIEKMDSAYQVKSLIITDDERRNLEALLPTGVSSFYPYTSDYATGFTSGGHDFNHALSMIFNAQYRRLVHNRKYFTSYKYYYDVGGAGNPVRITERERKQLNQSANRIRPSISVSSPNRRSGIDD